MRRRRRRSLRRLTRSRRSRARYFIVLPQSRWETRRRKGRRLKRASAMLVRPPDMASSLARISKDISRKAARWETACFRRLKPMRSPDIGYARRPSPSGCRGYNICFGTAVGNPASQSQRPCASPYLRPHPSANQRSVCARKARNSGVNEQSRLRGCERYGACDELVRPPGIFASARRKGTRFASAAHRA